MTIPEEPQLNRNKSNEKTPKYREGNNIQTFFKLYELTANLNGWTQDQEKLAHIHTSFKGQLQEWVISQTWDTWALFKEALAERQEAESRDEMYYLEKLLNTKRKNCATVNKFILKFDKLMQSRRNAQAEARLTIDLDAFYVKIFIKNSSPADLRRHLKGKTFNKLTEVYKIARSFEDEDSSDEDSSESGSSDDEFSDETDSSTDSKRTKTKAKKKKHSMVRPEAPKVIAKKKPSFKAALLTMLEQQQQQLLLIQQQQQEKQAAVVAPSQQFVINKRCYNCRVPGHFDDHCPEPCKHCGSRDHRRYQCANRPSARGIQPSQANYNAGALAESSNPILFMSVPDELHKFQESLDHVSDADLLAMKRLRSDETKAREVKKAKRVQKKAEKQAARITELQGMIESNIAAGPSSSSELVDQQDVDVDVPTEPETLEPSPSLPVLEPMNDDHVPENLTPPEVVHQESNPEFQVLPDPLVFNLSFNDIVALSSKAHTEFRRTLLSKAALENQDPTSISDLLLNQECDLPEGNHAPRVVAKLNGMQVLVILDTGCTPCIISYRLVQRLGLTDQLIALPSTEDGGILVGDGRRVKTKGLVKSLQLELLPGYSRKVDALCLEVPDGTYEFLCGRIAMAGFGLCADLGTSSWFVRNGDHFQDLEVHHTAPSSDQTCFLITVMPDHTNEEKAAPISVPIPSTDEEKFDKLFKDIDSNEMLNEEQREEIKALILSKSQAFGIGYNDLTQTNLVKFHVDTGDARPAYKRPYQNMSFSELETLKAEIGDMLRAGTLIPAMHSGAEAPNSDWSFQVMYVPKKNGEKRLVTMFQDLNKVTVTDPWPLPNINNLLETFGGCSYLIKRFSLRALQERFCSNSMKGSLLHSV